MIKKAALSFNDDRAALTAVEVVSIPNRSADAGFIEKRIPTKAANS